MLLQHPPRERGKKNEMNIPPPRPPPKLPKIQ